MFNHLSNRRMPQVVVVSLAVLCIAILTMVACNSSSKPSSETASSTQIIGAGSTFIYPVMTRWISDFQGSHPGVQINYQSIGSGGGIQQLKKGLVDFGASDAALDDQQLKEMSPVVQIPESAGPVCITYNLPDLKAPLKLSAVNVIGIFIWGTIKQLARPRHQERQSGRYASQYGNHRCSPLRREWHLQHLHHLPGQSQS